MYLDEIDFSILDELQRNGRKSYRKIASELMLSERVVKHRVNAMLREGVFQFLISVDPSRLGTVHVLIWLTTVAGKQDTIASELMDCEQVHFISAYSGDFNLLMRARFKDKKALTAFMNDHLAAMDGILGVTMNIELKTYESSKNRIIRKSLMS
ncbi:Lrp/AsnC family transcriptional regulator [Geomicrobium sp. JSM 1781026]|uniref:Lrp/AsnC family transcriptional regulator n=1 Tax=Geomicrobium sp. JSM 1781026 TaxID=3344580 RepID=UPI0035BF4F4D